MLPILLTTAFATRAPSLLYVDAVGPEPREFIQNLEERGVDVYRVFSRPFIAGVEQKGAPDEDGRWRYGRLVVARGQLWKEAAPSNQDCPQRKFHILRRMRQMSTGGWNTVA